jgi:signal-transduction protein with cAMP-binding, CBS, and nucleotidyltransferase domain
MDRKRRTTAEEVLEEKGSQIFSVSKNTTLLDALQIMNEKKIGAILVKDDDNIFGIWTERDLMIDSIKPGFDLKSSVVGDYMTTDLHTAPHDCKIFTLADMILGLRIRHIIIEREGKFMGVLSSGDILRAGLQLRTEEMKELDTIVHLDYYDEWKWKNKKK